MGRNDSCHPARKSRHHHRGAHSRFRLPQRAARHRHRRRTGYHRSQHRDRREADAPRTFAGPVPHFAGSTPLHRLARRGGQKRPHARPRRDRNRDTGNARRPGRCGMLHRHAGPVPASHHETLPRGGDLARMRGFRYVASAPLVRSSYMAEEALLNFRKED